MFRHERQGIKEDRVQGLEGESKLKHVMHKPDARVRSLEPVVERESTPENCPLTSSCGAREEGRKREERRERERTGGEEKGRGGEKKGKGKGGEGRRGESGFSSGRRPTAGQQSWRTTSPA